MSAMVSAGNVMLRNLALSLVAEFAGVEFIFCHSVLPFMLDFLPRTK
jgi:hypothetical protein